MRYYATLGPACCEASALAALLRRGVSGFRLNVSHTMLAARRDWIDALHDAERSTGLAAQLMIDLRGPEVRIGALPSPLTLTAGEAVTLGADIPVEKDVLAALVPGMTVLLDWMDLCDVVTIARGDLGSSLPLEQLPAAQKHIAALCRSRRKPFLVVTQLLHSMIDHPTPTRAEVLDIYNAVLDGADCLMLTGETAQGRYPLAALDWLMRVAQEAQRAR